MRDIRDHVLIVESFVDSIGVHFGGVVNEIVQLSSGDFCDLLRCKLHRTRGIND